MKTSYNKETIVCAVIGIILLAVLVILGMNGYLTRFKEVVIDDTQPETEILTVVSREIAPEPTFEVETEPEVETIIETTVETETEPETEIVFETETENAPEPVQETEVPDTESPTPAPAQTGTTYLGVYLITGYTAEAGFPAGQATHSGYPVGPGVCAMNYWQRIGLGIEWGELLYIEGLGTFAVYDSGCEWGVVDVWVPTNAEAFAMTANYNVYLVR